MSVPTKAEIRQARKYGPLLPQFATYDMVFAVKPDGQEILIKGRDLLDAVVAAGRGKSVTRIRIPVLTDEVAAALERELGNDGTFSAPSHTGHA